MPVTQPRQEGADHPAPRAASPAAPPAGAEPARQAGKPATAQLADDLAVPTPSPVHRLQAGLAQLTTSEEARAEGLYPGWFRLVFPLAASTMLWAAILWGVGAFA